MKTIKYNIARAALGLTVVVSSALFMSCDDMLDLTPQGAFTDEQLGILWKCGSAVRSGCCSRLDITPLGEVIYCLSLATVLSKPYYEFEDYDHAKDWFETKLAPYRRLGRKIECATCTLMTPEKCNGACLAKNLIGVKHLKLQ